MPWIQDVNVTKAGPAENGTIYIALQTPSWHRWFRAEPSIEKEMLASALTAVSGGKTAQVRVTSEAAYSTIQRFYVKT